MTFSGIYSLTIIDYFLIASLCILIKSFSLGFLDIPFENGNDLSSVFTWSTFNNLPTVSLLTND